MDESIKASGTQKPRFRPSVQLAERIRDAAIQSVEGIVGPYLLPEVDRLDVGPNGVPDSESAALEQIRESVGIRVERMLATIAFRAAARGEDCLLISDGQKFVASVGLQLQSALPIDPDEAGRIFREVQKELRDSAERGEIRGDWGALEHKREGLCLRIDPLRLFQSNRVRATVIGAAGAREPE